MKDPRIYTLSSTIIGYLLIGKLNSYEQNALGNWLMNIGQVLETNAAFSQMLQYNESQKQLFKSNNLSTKDKEEIKEILSDIENLLNQIKKEL
jgi:hypothetical protein